MGNINGYEIWLMMVNNYLVGGWALVLWKMMELWVSSSIFLIMKFPMEKNRTCSKAPSRKFLFAPLDSDNKNREILLEIIYRD